MFSLLQAFVGVEKVMQLVFVTFVISSPPTYTVKLSVPPFILVFPKHNSHIGPHTLKLDMLLKNDRTEKCQARHRRVVEAVL